MSFLTLPRIQRAAFLLLVLVLLAPLGAAGQWTLRSNVKAKIRTVYFIDGPFIPHTGFLGLEDGTLLRSSDGGSSWKVVLPVIDTPGRAPGADIFFVDSLRGWFVRWQSFPGQKSLFATTDGGYTWAPQNIGGQGVSVHFIPALHRLILAGRSFGASYSDDSGKTWSLGNGTDMNGISFATEKNGVIGTGPPTTKPQLMTTSDGGSTWKTYGFAREVYQPLAIVNSSTYFLSAEETGASTQTDIYRSDDGGRTWPSLVSFPTGRKGTGCMRGTLNRLFFQTIDDVLESTDQGLTWQSTSGPGHVADDRFFYSDRALYAADSSGQVFRLIIAPQPESQVSPAPLVFDFDSNFTCDTLFRDSALVYTNTAQDITGWITSISTSPNFTVSATLPIAIQPRGMTQIPIRFTAASVGGYSGQLTVTIVTGTTTRTDIITLKGELHHEVKAVFSSSSAAFANSFICDSADIDVTIKNLSCDPLTITGLSTPSPPYAVDASTLGGKTMASGATLPVHIHRSPSSAGNHTDSLVLVGQGSQNRRTTVKLPITAQVLPQQDLVTYVKPVSINGSTDSIVRVPVYARVTPASLAVQNIHFELSVTNSDLLTPFKFTSANNSIALLNFGTAQNGNPISAKVSIDLGINTIVSSEILLGWLVCKVAVAASQSSDVFVSSISPPSVVTCDAYSIATDTTHFVLTPVCGDRLISDYLRTGNLEFDVRRIAPNPAANILNIELQKSVNEPLLLELIDALGRVSYSGSTAEATAAIDLTGIASGVYELRISGLQQRVNRKIVVQH